LQATVVSDTIYYRRNSEALVSSLLLVLFTA